MHVCVEEVQISLDFYLYSGRMNHLTERLCWQVGKRIVGRLRAFGLRAKPDIRDKIDVRMDSYAILEPDRECSLYVPILPLVGVGGSNNAM